MGRTLEMEQLPFCAYGETGLLGDAAETEGTGIRRRGARQHERSVQKDDSSSAPAGEIDGIAGEPI